MDNIAQLLKFAISQEFDGLNKNNQEMFTAGYHFGVSKMINTVMDLLDTADGKTVRVSDVQDVMMLAATPTPFEDK